MKSNRKAQLVLVAVCFFFLFNFPIIGLIDGVSVMGEIPLMYVYFYALSLLLIGIVSFMLNRQKK